MAKQKRGFMDGYRKYDPSSEGYGNARQWKSAFRERMGIPEAEEYLASFNTSNIPFISRMERATTLAELKKIYHEAMKQTHPDVGGDVKVAQAIVAKYTVLKERFS